MEFAWPAVVVMVRTGISRTVLMPYAPLSPSGRICSKIHHSRSSVCCKTTVSSGVNAAGRLTVSKQEYLYKGKGERSPYSIIERRLPELIPVLGSQHAGDVSHKPGGRLPLLSASHAVTPATLKRAANNLAAWGTEARWVRTVCLRLLPDSLQSFKDFGQQV